jgi:dTDP-4-amino-4,6-dideoxygalactose transaminase
LKIIEDNAQSFGAKYKNKYLGTVGDIGVFSFNVHKNLQCGEGGVITTNNPILARRAQLIRNHGEVVVDELANSDEKNYEIILGNNYRLSELHAAIAIEQVKKRHKLIDPCIKMAEYLSKKIRKFPWLEGVKVLKNTTHTYYVYPFKFYSEKIGISRDTFEIAMLAENMPIHAGYTKPLYLIRLYQRKQIYPRSKFPFESKEYPSNVKYHKGICPQVEHLEEKEMMFTTICHPPQTTKDIDLWVHALEKIEDQRDKLIAYEKRRNK